MANLLDRRSDLWGGEITVLRGAVRKIRTLVPSHIDAWTVRPKRLHCLWTLSAIFRPSVCQRWQADRQLIPAQRTLFYTKRRDTIFQGEKDLQRHPHKLQHSSHLSRVVSQPVQGTAQKQAIL